MKRNELHADALPVVLRQSRRRRAWAAFVGAWWAFVAGCGAVLATGRGAETGTGTRVVGALILVGAAPLALYWLLQLLPGSTRLVVAPDGLHVRHAFVTRRRRWEDVQRFYVRRLYGHPPLADWHGVAMVLADARPAGVGSWLERILRIRGVFDTDLLPDTYGLQAAELRAFLAECDRRWSGEKAAPVPKEIRASRGFYVLNGLLLSLFGGFFLLAAVASATDEAWGTAALMLLFASPFALALWQMLKRWRRPTIRARGY